MRFSTDRQSTPGTKPAQWDILATALLACFSRCSRNHIKHCTTGALISSRLANSNNHTSCNHTNPLCGHFQAWGMTTKPSKPPAGEILATFDDKTPAVVANTVGKGLSIHFYFFPGTSYFYGYTANTTAHRGSGGRASQWTLSGLLYNLTTGAGMGGVIPPVTTSNMHVEAPLLQGPTGSVVTLLNWSPDDTNKIVNASTSLLTVEVALGFSPSKVESVEHGALTATPVPGKTGVVSVRLPLASADFLMYHK